MFDIGFSEIVVIAVVALIVIGPERLPKVARTLGPGHTVVTLLCDRGSLYFQRLFNPAWLADHLRSSAPLRVPGSGMSWAVCRAVTPRSSASSSTRARRR